MTGSDGRATVSTTLERYRTAVAELPLHARLGDPGARGGGIVVVSGTGRWVDAAARAGADGAAALVVADPIIVPAAAVQELAAHLRIPVVIERPRLRPDAVHDARTARTGSPPRLLVAEGSAPAGALDLLARDACGWLRSLTDGALRVLAGDRTLALLESALGVPATLGAVSTARASAGMRVEALGEVRTQVDIGVAVRITTTSSAGALTAPARFESSARLALRRALDALATGSTPSDAAELAEDTALLEHLRVSDRP